MGRREKNSDPSILRQTRRQVSSLSLVEFARRIGYSASYLSAVELGHLPSSPELLVAYEMGLDLEEGTLTSANPSVARLINRASAGLASAEGSLPRSSPQFMPGRIERHSYKEILAGTLALLHEASIREPIEGRAVHITWAGPVWELESEPEDLAQWTYWMTAVLQRGWAVNHLIQLPGNRDRTLMLIESLLGVLGAEGRYRALSHDAGDPPDSAYELVVIPDTGALTLIASRPASHDAVLFVRDSTQIEILESYCLARERVAGPLIEPITRSDQIGFERRIFTREHLSGDRFLVKNGLYSLACPTSWYSPESQWAKRTGLTGLALDEFIALRKERRSHWEERLRYSHFRDICPKQAIEDFMLHGVDPRLNAATPETAEITGSEVVELLQQLISDLKAFPNYEVALIDEAETKLLQADDNQQVLYWSVKDDLEVLLETWTLREDDEEANVHIVINDRVVAGAFADHFRKIWGRLSPSSRDKESVIEWIDGVLTRLSAPS